MEDRVQNAVNYHKSFYPCSAAVLCAFSEEAGLDKADAKREAMPFAGGRMVKCGAVLAAEYVLKRKYPGDKGEALSRQFEQSFLDKNSSVVCQELKGRGTGVVLRSCRDCVTDAAELLDEMLKEN